MSKLVATGLRLVGAALLLGPGAAAAMTITASATPPTGPSLLALSGTAGGSYDCDHGTGPATTVGQTFRLPAAGVLERVTLRVRPQTPIGGELMTLSFGTFSDPADDSMDALIAAETRALPAGLTPGVTVYLTFDIGDHALVGGRQYGFLLAFAGLGGVDDARLDVLHLATDAYAGGQAIGEAATWPTTLGDDLIVYLHGRTAATPEPLLLLGGRFRVEVAWETTAGATGEGHPYRLTDRSGYFWFFEEENVELIVKAHDACIAPFDHYWVFMSGLTDVGVTVTVTDTVSGLERTYATSPGTVFLPILDTRTFATCDA